MNNNTFGKGMDNHYMLHRIYNIINVFSSLCLNSEAVNQ